MRKVAAIVFVLFATTCGSATAQKNKVGFFIGQWQPNSLKVEEPASVFSGTADSSPFLSLHGDFHFWAEISLHTSVGYWGHLFRKGDSYNTLSIFPIDLGIEHALVSQSALSPYALYGAGLLLVSYSEGRHIRKPFRLKQLSVGFEIFLITGIQIKPVQPFGIDINFGYIIANLPSDLGINKDYSGLRATIGLFLSF